MFLPEVLKYLRFAVVPCLLCSAVSVAHAQQPAPLPAPRDLVPGAVDPGRVQEHVAAAPLDDARSVVKKPEAPITATKPPLPQAMDPAQSFEVRGWSFSGNTAIDDTALSAILGDYTGARVDEDFVYALAEYLSAIYRERGYFLSRVMVQSIDAAQGTVGFLVIEGYVEEVRIDTDSLARQLDHRGIVDGAVARIRAMKPLHGPTLERQLLILNDLYGVSVESTLVPLSDRADPPLGAVGMVLTIIERPRLFGVQYNNFGSIFTGPGQNLYTANLKSPFGAFDNIRVQALHALPIDEMRYGLVEYAMPLHDNGLSASLRGYRSLTRPSSSLTPFEMKGESESVSLSVSYPLMRTRSENLYLSAGFEWRNSKTSALGELLFEDRLRIAQAGISYGKTGKRGNYTMLSLNLTQGLNILGETPTGSENLSRAEGRSDFTKIDGRVSHFEYLPYGFGVWGGITGQYAFTPLLSSEEFGYGGQGAGRAYDSSEIVGDHGVSAFVELRYQETPRIEKLKLSLEPYVFYDVGKVWNIESGLRPESGASAGFGVRSFIGDTIRADGGVAFPLTRPIANPVRGDEDSPRLYFQVSADF